MLPLHAVTRFDTALMKRDTGPTVTDGFRSSLLAWCGMLRTAFGRKLGDVLQVTLSCRAYTIPGSLKGRQIPYSSRLCHCYSYLVDYNNAFMSTGQ
jgi:hypothetical protein